MSYEELNSLLSYTLYIIIFSYQFRNRDLQITSYKIGKQDLIHQAEPFFFVLFFYKSVAIFQMQPYLEKVNIRKFCQAFSLLRMSSHRLEIESGRWMRPNSTHLDDRKCNLCNVLEDDFHFVLECNMFVELRKKYISRYYRNRPSMHKFISLINKYNET